MRRVQRSELPQFSILLGAMFLELVVGPMLVELPGAIWITRGATSLVLLAALGVVGLRKTGIALFVLAAAAQAVASHDAAPWAAVAAQALRLAFLAYAFGRVLAHVLREQNVTLDTLAAAVCTYMLLGLIWCDLYTIMVQWDPTSFSIPDTFQEHIDANLRASMLYFSFTTLTTVGYGDIHAANPAAGGLAVSEAVAGQVYLAVLIARLVGMHLSSGGSSGVSPGGETPGERVPSSDGTRE